MDSDKLDLSSPDLVNENFEKLAALFPNCVTETTQGKAIDFDLLKQELNHAVIDGTKERYRLEWPGKREAIVTANLPTTKTLRPVREDSVDFDNTENLYIEGDNLEVLKLLQESYLGKIKMIYIDPPYNTGKDFVYKDNFTKDAQDELVNSGQKDEYNQHLISNPENSGRYHSDWLSMMFARLKLARILLQPDGVVFISIDDNEVHNLRKICDEIFGEGNFAAQFPWRKRTAKSDVPFGISQDYEWVLCYVKENFIAGIEGGTRKYYTTPDFPDRPWRIHDLTKQTSANERPNSFFTIVNPKNGKKYPANPNRTWAVTEDTYPKYYAENRIVFPGDYDFLNITKPSFRYFKEDDEKKAGEMFGYIPLSTNLPGGIGMSQDGTKDFAELFENKFFSYPKPVELIKYLVQVSTNFSKDSIVLDFFSGSATTAQAIMQLNAEDGGKRKYIMVQLPEKTDENSEASKAGYFNICEIGKERIRRAAKELVNKYKAKRAVKEAELQKITEGQISLDIISKNFEINTELNKLDSIIHDSDWGFRVYRLSDSNMQDVYYKPQEYNQETLDMFADNVKPDRTPDDLLAQVMLDWGLPLSLKIEQSTISGKQVFKVAGNSLYACFDKGIDEEFAKAIAGEKPLRIVFRDNGFKDDTAKINVKQLLKQLSQDTEMKVI